MTSAHRRFTGYIGSQQPAHYGRRLISVRERTYTQLAVLSRALDQSASSIIADLVAGLIAETWGENPIEVSPRVLRRLDFYGSRPQPRLYDHAPPALCEGRSGA